MFGSTVGLGATALAPMLSTLPNQIPLVISMGISTLTLVCSFDLPAPGSYLPKVDKTEKPTNDDTISRLDTQVQQSEILDNFNQSSFAPLQGYTFHQMSFNQTKMDRQLSVTRPNLQRAGSYLQAEEARATLELQIYEQV